MKSWLELFQYEGVDWYRITNIEDAENTAALYLSSSGTTGQPKTVVMSHRALLAAGNTAMYAGFDRPVGFIGPGSAERS